MLYEDSKRSAQAAEVKKQGSLKKVFLSVLLLSYLITAAATIAVFYVSSGRIADEYVSRFAVSRCKLEKNRLLSLLEGELVLSRKLADDPVIVRWMLNENDSQASAAAGAQLESYRKFLRSNTHFAAILKTGSYYFNDITAPNDKLDPSEPYDRWFYNAIKEDLNYFLNVDYNISLDEIKVWFNVMVRDESGKPVGLAGSGMNLGSFLENFSSHNQPGISSIIINSAGHLQAHKDASLIEFNARTTDDNLKKTIYDLLEGSEDKEALTAAINKAEKTGDPSRLELTIEGGKVIAAVGSIPQLQWYNIVLVESGSVISFADFMPLGFVFLLSLLAVLAAITVILNRLILVPLGKLTRAAGVVAAGAYSTELPQISKNEIGRLSDSFNTMTAKIREYTSGLEIMVEKRTEALNIANRELIESQKRITDSIEYAKLIQNSVLPPEEELNQLTSEHFTIFRPLDIVGGDFYYLKKEADRFCIAVIDCTGHGVPGAFMTMMTAALLNRVIETSRGSGPAQMLQRLHKLIQQTLRSQSRLSHVENGLDIALCVIEPGRKLIRFAGAGLPLLIAENGQISEIAGDKLHIGFTTAKKEMNFTETEIEISSEAVYYMFTDGILDLPGGAQGFGLGRKKFKKIIKSHLKKPLSQQRDAIISDISEYQNNYRQRDDIAVIGFKIKFGEN